MIDLDYGWPTERLDLEPLTVAHAAELAPLLDDIAWHDFTGGAPLSAAALAARYKRLSERRCPAVISSAGLAPTGEVRDGEIRWASPPAATAS